jgi:hypothetical protein
MKYSGILQSELGVVSEGYLPPSGKNVFLIANEARCTHL